MVRAYHTIDGYGTYVIYTIPIPGKYLGESTAYLDLETRKVPCFWHFPNGVPLNRRWMAFIAGVATGEVVKIIEASASEQAFLAGVRTAVGTADTVIYLSANSFDEGILKGRYTYARRGWADVPFYPVMPGADELTWDRRRDLGDLADVRERELDSRYVSATYERDPGLVLVHNLRDVVQLVLAFGEPDADCEAWCRKVLTDLDFAGVELFGSESGYQG
jgi:hypothetical protein